MIEENTIQNKSEGMKTRVAGERCIKNFGPDRDQITRFRPIVSPSHDRTFLPLHPTRFNAVTLPAMDITKFIVDNRESAFLLGDFGTYRAQLSRRLRTVRKKLGRATAKNAKYAPKAPVTAQEVGKNIEYDVRKFQWKILADFWQIPPPSPPYFRAGMGARHGYEGISCRRQRGQEHIWLYKAAYHIKIAQSCSIC